MRSTSVAACVRMSSTGLAAATFVGTLAGAGVSETLSALVVTADSLLVGSPESWLAMAATLAVVDPSAPRSTKLISPSVD